MMAAQVWNVEIDGPVATVTIDKPPLNLVMMDDIVELGQRLAELRQDPGVRAIVLTGIGKAFIGGADVSQFKTLDPVTAKFSLQAVQRVFRDMEEMEKPVLAAVNGFAFGGGCEVILACDIRICAERARFGQLEINYGIIPGWAGTQRLTRVVGFGRAKDLILTGRIIDAPQALGMGLVSEVVPDVQLMEKAGELAGLLASKAPVAMALAKEMVNASSESSISVGGAFEAAACAITMGTEDCLEGVRSFMEKRDPEFKGK
jgi:enoyl-CoA hydratase